MFTRDGSDAIAVDSDGAETLLPTKAFTRADAVDGSVDGVPWRLSFVRILDGTMDGVIAVGGAGAVVVSCKRTLNNADIDVVQCGVRSRQVSLFAHPQCPSKYRFYCIFF